MLTRCRLHLHRALNLLGVVALTAAAIIAFIKLDSLDSVGTTGTIHKAAGVLSWVLALLLVAAGIFRPKKGVTGEKKPKLRSIWEIAHKSGGALALIIGIIAVFTGFHAIKDLGSVSGDKWRNAAIVVLAVVAAIWLLMLAAGCLKVRPRCLSGHAVSSMCCPTRPRARAGSRLCINRMRQQSRRRHLASTAWLLVARLHGPVINQRRTCCRRAATRRRRTRAARALTRQAGRARASLRRPVAARRATSQAAAAPRAAWSRTVCLQMAVFRPALVLPRAAITTVVHVMAIPSISELWFETQRVWHQSDISARVRRRRASGAELLLCTLLYTFVAGVRIATPATGSRQWLRDLRTAARKRVRLHLAGGCEHRRQRETVAVC